MALSVCPQAVFPADVTLTLNGSAQKLVDRNPLRSHLQFQAPADAAITYSYTNTTPNDPAGTLLTGCYILAAGATFGPSTSVPGSAIYVNGGSTGSGKLLIATEC